MDRRRICHAPRFHWAVNLAEGSSTRIAGAKGGLGCGGNGSPGYIAATAFSQVCSECSPTRCLVVLRRLAASSSLNLLAVVAFEASGKGGSDGAGGASWVTAAASKRHTSVLPKLS